MALTSLHSIILISLMLLNLIVAPVRQEPTLDRKMQQLQQHFSSLALERDEGDLLPTGAHLRTVLGETDALLRECEQKLQNGEFPGEEIALMEGQREQLLLLDREFQAIFQAIESKLTGAGLTSKLSTLRDFVQYYHGRMSTLQAQVEALIQSGKNPDARAAESQIKRLRSALAGALHKDEDWRTFGQQSLPTSPPVIERGMATRQGSSQALAAQDDQPTPAHLAESPVVQLTPEIRAKASELENSPAKIYEFVRNQFDFEPYFGMMQGSQSVFGSGRGNNYDLATFLIALLRAANIPARYVLGQITLRLEDVRNWVGAKDPQVAQNIIRIATFAEPSGDVIRLDHVWVEAYVRTNQGEQWVALDPSFKLKNYQPGLQIPKPAFDRMAFISSVKTTLSTEAYADQIRQYLRQNQPGKALSDAVYTGRIIPVQTGLLPSALPYEVTSIVGKVAELDRTFHHRLRVSVIDLSTGTSLVSAQLSIPEVSLKSVTVSFGPASAEDKRTIDLFGGLANTPAFLAAVVPQIRLDGKIIASGTTAPPVGQFVRIAAAYLLPRRSETLFEGSHFLRVGETGNIGLDGHQITDRLLSQRIDRVVNGDPALGSGDPEATVREMLHIAALRYFQRIDTEKRRVGDPLQLKFILWFAMEGATLSTLQVTNLFDRPFVVTPSSMVLDADGLNVFFVDINAPDSSAPGLIPFRQMLGLTASALEHQLWEEIVFIPSISTTKALQIASESRIRIQVINRSNASSILPRLRIPDSIKQSMQQDIDRGFTIITPEQPVRLNNWQGLGWISESPDASAFGYFIAQFSGGATTRPGREGDGPPNAGPQGDPTGTNGTTCGQPVTVSSGNMWHQFKDLNISSRGFPIVLRRTYNSQAPSDGPFGVGWTHSYNMFLKDQQRTVTFVNESGGRFTFTQQGNSYTSPPGLNMMLTKDQQGFTLREKEGTELRFDTTGKLQSITDRNKNALRFAYDSQGNLQTITDALGRTITFSYNAQNRIVSVQDFAARQLSYSYDASGNLIESVDVGGNKTTYTYYNNKFNDHNLKTITFPEGNTITYVYYGNDKVFKIINPGGGEMRFVYLPLRQETLMIDERDFVTTFQYNANGNVTRIINPDGNYVDQVWSNDAKLISRTDEAGFTFSFKYDEQGNLLETANPLGNIMRFTYEPKFNQVTSFTDANGNLTRFEYDAKGNPTKIIDALGGETTLTYDSFGNLLTVTDAEGNTTSTIYDTQGNPVEFRDALGNVTKLKFDALGRITSRIDALNNELRAEYDNRNRITKFTDELGNVTSFSYDRNGNLVQRTDATGNVTRYAYNQLNKLSR